MHNPLDEAVAYPERRMDSESKPGWPLVVDPALLPIHACLTRSIWVASPPKARIASHMKIKQTGNLAGVHERNAIMFARFVATACGLDHGIVCLQAWRLGMCRELQSAEL